MEKNLVEVVFIIDKSGSMGGLERETIKGYNDFLSKQKELEGDAIVSTVLFNNQFKTIHDREKIETVKLITHKEYNVGGTTALYDAIGRSINNIENTHKKLYDYQKPNKVIFVIITDGMENSSKEYSHHVIKKMIGDKKELDNWEFIFMGANFDAESFAESINIERENAVRYEFSDDGIEKNYEAMSYMISEARINTDHNTKSDWKKKVKQDDSNE